MGPPASHVSPFIRKSTVVPYFKVSMNVGFFDWSVKNFFHPIFFSTTQNSSTYHGICIFPNLFLA
jgi:hypothetical protein